MRNIIQTSFKTFKAANLESQFTLSHIPEGLKPFLLAYYYQEWGSSLVFVTQDNAAAEQYETMLKDLGVPSASLPYYEILPYENESIPEKIIHKRLATLKAIQEGIKRVYFVPVRSLLFPVIKPEHFTNQVLLLKIGESIKRNTLLETLVELGYERVPHVSRVGEYALRGEVFDIFPLYAENPLRFELFDEEIEKIKNFDLLTQTSLPQSEKKEVRIHALREFFLSRPLLEELLAKLSQEFPPALIASFREYAQHGSHDINYLPFFSKGYGLPHFFRDSEHDFTVVVEHLPNLEAQERTFTREIKELYYSSFNLNKVKAHPADYSLSLASQLEMAPQKVTWDILHANQAGFFVNSLFTATPSYQGRIELFRQHQKDWEGYSIQIGCYYEGQQERIRDIFPELDTVLSLSLESGFINHKEKLVFILEQELFGKKYLTHRKKNILLNSSPIDSFSDLERGDYVVHINHGVGRYEGMEKLSVLGKNKDYIKISYADENTLYVPVEQVFLIHKYLGGEGTQPRLDTLGGKNWEKRKERVRARIEAMAEELAILYEKRRQLKGFQYPVDTRWQHEFEAGFPYEETPDQLQAILDIKADMESPAPMDRLVCGDVGYGKTEVAMRAAFKAVGSGKQVAVLVPTTLLAEQHYQTFCERFDNFALSIKMLSRLVSAAEEKKVLSGLSSGTVDIVIGTHKILSEKIIFKDLGLLIVDEEQRFGVRHKERVKQMKASIDVLTLSATPIPRTLYMGLSNLRDMSLITTPPVSRMPIKTHVMPFNDNVLKQAVERELDRGGQVFIIHNRVKTIEQFAQMLRGILPQARIAIGHGQMTPQEMENVFLDFMAGSFDILLSTTIVENGIDIPNANTIIIDRPELLGLSELYQLRGRVGRSDRQGYAYLFYDPVQGLNIKVQRRLEVIEEYTDLGSGFKIAMKDLEIRGAGNVLGEEQNGFIADVGMDLYARIMREAVQKVKGLIHQEELEPLMDLSFNGFIPDGYIEEEKERFSIYRMIMRASKILEIDELTRQIQDRYGKFPESVEDLLLASRIKVLCKNLGIKELKEQKDFFQLEFIQQHKMNPARLAGLIQSGSAQLVSQGLRLKKSALARENTLNDMLEFLGTLVIPGSEFKHENKPDQA